MSACARWLKLEGTGVMRGIQSLNHLSRRCYAATRISPLTEPLGSPKPSKVIARSAENVQVSKLPSGLVVASLETFSPVSKIGVFVKAGSRYEPVGNLGVTHLLRLAGNLTTKGVSAFKISRGLEALGSTLSVTSTREHMVYSLDFLRDDFDHVIEYLANLTTATDFRPWEVSELTSRVKIDKALAAQCAQTSVLENLHQAAYKNALANSLYCPDFRVGKISRDNMQEFVANNYTSSRMAVVGLGVSHSALKQVAQQFFDVHKGAGASGDKAIYHGGELRVQNGDSLTHTLLACEGAASGTAEANAFSVLQQLLGVGPQVKRGSSISSKLSQGIAKATTQPFDASAFNISYSDSGLFGLYTIAQAGSAKEVIKAAMAQVSAVAKGVSEQDLIRAKSQLKTEYLMVLEGSEGLLEEIGAQALASGAYSSPDDVAKAIDSVTSSDVANAAKKFVSSKKTMASRGHLVNTPFVDEL
ncbi:cytochrome b-c1 complex subunit 2, mitochondrial [Astyanax mexicanus]|uniref:Ubiquinol-cytochrome c reductase core protein 2a n=1 Tax=Astyanax mexicanus TaxID=7994 RepID=W5L8A1_ASTMX|nr:cytochrome b-c1 complex subunit 2, mitochondrial [Astyanax mexicanus]